MGVFNWLKKQTAAAAKAVFGVEDNSEMDSFLFFKEWRSVTSSNVKAIQYDREGHQLTVEYHDGSFYQYQDISPSEAKSMAEAGSKGKWVWDNLRVRGTVFGFQKPYVFLSGPSKAKRGWMKTRETRKKHGDIGPSGW